MISIFVLMATLRLLAEVGNYKPGVI